MRDDYREPVYTIGIVAKKLNVCQATLRIWEKKKLIKAARIGKNRFYSRWDLDRLQKIKELIQEKRINIEGVKKIMQTTRCWEIKKCKPQVRKSCPVFLKISHA